MPSDPLSLVVSAIFSGTCILAIAYWWFAHPDEADERDAGDW